MPPTTADIIRATERLGPGYRDAIAMPLEAVNALDFSRMDFTMSDRIRSLSALRWLAVAALVSAIDSAALAAQPPASTGASQASPAQQPSAQPIAAQSPPAPVGQQGTIGVRCSTGKCHTYVF